MGDELVIYDLSRDCGHALNPTAAFVFEQCDGQTSVDQIADRMATELNISHTRQVTDLALERLRQAGLLAETAPIVAAGLSRRDVLKLAGKAGFAAAMLPVVTTLLVPSAAQAQSGGGTGDCQRCQDDYNRCLTDNCDPNVEIDLCPEAARCYAEYLQCLGGCQ
ncbi:MAG: hypothetical protein Kow0031_05350 [Anaerolineae bacterium]